MSESKEDTKKTERKEQELSKKEKIILAVPIVVLLTGMVMTLIYPMGIEENGVNFFGYVKYASVSVLIAGTSLLIGGFTGFLFGIPRTVQDSDNSDNSQVSYSANTNLEQISDWLTKILVGVGLTQLSSVPYNLEKLSIFLTQTLGDNQDKNSGIYAVIVILYFLICGFPLGYLSTRLLITTAFARADNAALNEMEKRIDNKLTDTTEKIEKTLTTTQRQIENNAKAIALVDLYLESTDRKEVSIKDIRKVIQEASSSIKQKIFSQVQEIRKNNWDKEEDKEQIDHVVHILQILLEDNSEDTFEKIPEDKLWAELGYAVKDKEHPNWKESAKYLQKAIDIRGSWRDEGHRMYEFNRAYSLIMLDKGFNGNEENSNNEKRQEIIDLIAIAVSRKKLRRIVTKNEVFQRWIKLNNVTQTELDQESDEQVKEELPNIICSENISHDQEN